MKRILALFLLTGGLVACTSPSLDLSGTWEFCLDAEGTVKADAPFAETIELPGTTDLAGKGAEPGEEVETARLTRRHAYVGKAWYRKTIRTPQQYVLGRLKAGKHTIALCVDNGGGVPEGVIRSSHLYSEDTQTNWNGVIGQMEIRPLKADGHPVFLRGKHDACVFPLTGHTPMDKESWLKYFGTCKDYGFNHVRFHSWCPPEAAFAAADELGIYLQPETSPTRAEFALSGIWTNGPCRPFRQENPSC